MADMDSSTTVTDDLILEQTRQIQAEQTEAPLIGPRISTNELRADYADASDIFRIKTERLAEEFALFRRVRRDGNCFYRAFVFELAEHIRKTYSDGGDRLLQNVLEKLDTSKKLLEALGISLFIFEDYHEVAYRAFSSLPDHLQDASWLESVLCDEEASNEIVLYFRFVTMAELKHNEEKYLPFIDNGLSMSDFCGMQVESFGVEADTVQIAALCAFFNVSLRVVYLDQSPGDCCNVHTIEPSSDCTHTRIHLLYRPGHYDILYTT